MSKLLGVIITELREKKINYEEYLKKMALLAKKVSEGEKDDLPNSIKTSALRALFNNLNKNKSLALQIDKAVRRVKQVDFRGNEKKERLIKQKIYQILQDDQEVERIFSIIKEQKDY